MKDKRAVLYILLGMCLFLIWEAWQKDFGKKGDLQEQTSVNKEVTEQKRNPAFISPHAQLEKSEGQQKESGLQKNSEQEIVRVKTDLLDLLIDQEGGELVQADLLKYPEIMHQHQPVRLLSKDSSRYYVALSGLVGEMGPDYPNKKANYKVAKKDYQMGEDQDSLQVKFLWQNGELKINKIFEFTRGKYDIDVRYEIDNQSQKAWQGKFYAELERKNFDEAKGLFKISTYTGAAISSPEKPYEKISFADIKKSKEKGKEFIRDATGGWIAMQQRHFLSVWIPGQEETHRYFGDAYKGIYTIGFSDNLQTVLPGKQATIGAKLYIGPEVVDNLKPLAAGLDRTVDYGPLWLIAIGFFWCLQLLYSLIGNWGVAIILLTLLIKLLFYKLSESACRSTARMREIMPKMQALKDRYGDDRQKLQHATMELYKREKINPFNLGGCLPMLVQIPFFIALYYVLVGAVQLRHAPFMLWINDLSAADPFYILPLIMGVTMFLQQKMTPSSTDPTQAKMMMFLPVIFTFFFLNFPSGLVLYWIVNNVLSILQQWYINKQIASGVHQKCQIRIKGKKNS